MRAMMKTALFAAGGIALLTAGVLLWGCGAAKSPEPQASTRALARGAVEVVERAWLNVAHKCVEVASEQDDMALSAKCGGIMMPAKEYILVAATEVNNWTPLDLTDFSCNLKKGLDGTEGAAFLLQSRGVSRDPALDDAIQLAKHFPCLPGDAGLDSSTSD